MTLLRGGGRFAGRLPSGRVRREASRCSLATFSSMFVVPPTTVFYLTKAPVWFGSLWVYICLPFWMVSFLGQANPGDHEMGSSLLF